MVDAVYGLLVGRVTWRWPSAGGIGVAGSALHGEGAGVGGVGNGGGVWWPGDCRWLGLWMVVVTV